MAPLIPEPVTQAQRSRPPGPSRFRRPRRISITIAEQAHDRLMQRSLEEGRSLSNLAAFLLEQALERMPD